MRTKEQRRAAALKGWATRRRRAAERASSAPAEPIVVDMKAADLKAKRRSAALRGWATRRRRAAERAEAVQAVSVPTVRIPSKRRAIDGIAGGRIASMAALLAGKSRPVADWFRVPMIRSL